jgi:predicted Fe-Mo cluster-binding NifX family protein
MEEISMKIAITACGDGWQERVDSRFGRAMGFFVVDTDDDRTSYIDNMINLQAAHGAGTSAAQSIVAAGVEIVISGEIGPKAASVLKAAGVRVMSGVKDVSIKEAYDLYQQGNLREQVL